jgi:hypothetical protein
MLTGQIGLCWTKGWAGRLIRFVTRSHFNHAIIAISETECVGAEPGGVRVRPITDYPNVVWSRFPVNTSIPPTWPDKAAAIVAFTNSTIGARYNYFDDVVIGLGLILRVHTPNWMLRILADPHSWQCAALCDAAYTAAGIHLFKDQRPFGAVYPGSYTPLFKDRGWL